MNNEDVTPKSSNPRAVQWLNVAYAEETGDAPYFRSPYLGLRKRRRTAKVNPCREVHES
jgi:hypothetical protein